MEHFLSFPLRACVRYRQSDICETDERVGCSLLSVNTSECDQSERSRCTIDPLMISLHFSQSDICETDERVGCSLLSVNTSD